jgi:hypothetical protein
MADGLCFRGKRPTPTTRGHFEDGGLETEPPPENLKSPPHRIF